MCCRETAQEAGSLHWLELGVPRATDLLKEIAARNGDAANASEIGRRLGLSCQVVRNRLALLEQAGVIRVLPSLASRRPHMQLRDCRLLHSLGGSLLALMRTCLTERITAGLAAGGSPVDCFQWEAGEVKRIDLVTRTARESIGFRFVDDPALRKKELAPFRLGVARGVIGRGYLIHSRAHAFVAARVVLGLPLWDFLGQLDQWLACGSFSEARDLLRRRPGLTPRLPWNTTGWRWAP